MPQRFLRPGITGSSRWNRVSWQAQSLFIRLLTLVDDFGRCDGRSSVIHGAAFAVWNEENPEDCVAPKDCAALCEQLASKGLISLYDADGKRVMQIEQWQERSRSDKSRWPSAGLRSGAQDCASSLVQLPSVIGHIPSVPLAAPPPVGEGPEKPEKNGAFSDGKPTPRLPTTPQSQRIANIMHRRLTTPWSDDEYKAYRKLGTAHEDDLAAVERYYANNWPPKVGVNNLRHDMMTLLNNWNGEVTRAHAAEEKARPQKNGNPHLAGMRMVTTPPADE